MKMAAKAKKTTATKKSSASKKKPAAKKAAVKKKTTAAKSKVSAAKSVSTKNIELQELDRKGLAARARLLKKELLAIRFNMQSPSLRDYRNKRKELASVLSRLGSN
jgi:ribosomal protein L29